MKMKDVEIEGKEKYLESVVRSFGRNVKIFHGKYRNCIGTLQSIDAKRYCGEIKWRIDNRDNKVIKVVYEHFSKMST